MAKADLHVHTTVSDGLASVAALLEYVEHETDLDVIAVTDHEDATGGHRARELAAQKGYRFEVVVGAEITTIHGHLVALFIERTPRMFRSVEATLEDIHAQDGIAVVPHPMSWLTRSLSRRTIERVQRRGEAGVTFDAIETCNPSPAGQINHRRVLACNADWGLVETGSSDAHHLRHVGTGWTEFRGSGTEGLRAGLLSGAVTPRMTRYPSLRELGLGRAALGLAWGYTATPRKALGLIRAPARGRR